MMTSTLSGHRDDEYGFAARREPRGRLWTPPIKIRQLFSLLLS